jgi:hypothetical protein
VCTSVCACLAHACCARTGTWVSVCCVCWRLQQRAQVPCVVRVSQRGSVLVGVGAARVLVLRLVLSVVGLCAGCPCVMRVCSCVGRWHHSSEAPNPRRVGLWLNVVACVRLCFHRLTVVCAMQVVLCMAAWAAHVCCRANRECRPYTRMCPPRAATAQ